jgi:hypothetical protein
MRSTIPVVVLVLALGMTWGQTGQIKKASKSDAEIKKAIINDSIASYRGNCPCPYNTDRAGRRCGGRSAYSRPGGASPICYAKDVTQKMVDDYRKRTEQQRTKALASALITARTVVFRSGWYSLSRSCWPQLRQGKRVNAQIWGPLDPTAEPSQQSAPSG